MRGKLMTWLMVLAAVAASGQDSAPDTVLSLPDVHITSSRINRYAKGQQSVSFDSLDRMRIPAATLSELLTGLTGAYVRNYGQGTLATFSLRGTSANHTSLFWNGIRVSPPNIGYVDLSLIQGGFFKDISLLYGGASPIFGSGAIGGSLHLSTRPVFGPSAAKITAAFSAGSFRTFALEGSAEWSGEKLFSRTAWSLNGSQNDFSYNDLYGNRDKLDHASVSRGGFLQDLSLKLSGQQYLMASLWFQYAGRDIPPTLTQNESEASQIDRSWRGMLSWKNYNRKSVQEARIAYFNEFTRYTDPSGEVYSVIRSQTAAASAENSLEFSPRSVLLAGVQYTYEFADLDFYAQAEDQQSISLYASFSHDFTPFKWQFSLNGRQEFVTGYRPPFLFSAGFQGPLWKFLSGRLSVSRNFRAPTLNERFWVPGGNPGLEPEKSWNFEAGVTLKPSLKDVRLSFDATAYTSLVDGWILWLPGASFWSVENAQKVLSRGIELSTGYEQQFGRLGVSFNGNYSFTRSTNQLKQFEFDESYHKQLIYTPIHRASVRPGISFRGFELFLRGNFTGLIYTSKDNADSLPGYFLMDVVASKTWALRHSLPLTVQMNLNNIFNMDYQVVPYRPMPGFNFLVTLRVAVGSQQSAVSSQQSAVSSQQSLNTKHQTLNPKH